MGWTRQEVLDVARSTGRPVVEAWSSHDAGQMGTVLGPMLHHTGSTWSYPTNTAPTLRTVREGRSDLQNALAMYYIDYEGVIYCITEKIAWHAGAGSWQGVTDGNGHYAGIEAESDGVQWTKPTVASYKHLAAAILRKTGRTVAYAPRHADYALPKGRKSDFSGMDPATFLADVNADLAGNATPGGFLMALNDDQQAELYNTVMQRLGGAALPIQVWDDLNPNPLIVERNGGKPREARGVQGDIYVHTVALLQQVAGLTAAVNALAAGAAGDGTTAEELRTVIREEMAKAIDVQVTVNGTSR